MNDRIAPSSINPFEDILKLMIEQGINNYDFYIIFEEIRFNVTIKKEVEEKWARKN